MLRWIVFGVVTTVLVVGFGVGPALAADVEGSQSPVVQASQSGDSSETRPPLFTLSELGYLFQKFSVDESPAELMDQLQMIRATAAGAVPR